MPLIVPLSALLKTTEWQCAEALLRKHDPFYGPLVPGFDWYDPEHVIGIREMFGTSVELVMDRNVFGRVLKLASARTGSRDELDRLAAAVMAFAIVTQSFFDPKFAVAEPVMSNGESDGREEALKFVSLQNQSARVFLQIAAGSASSLDPREVAKEKTPEAARDAKNLAVKFWNGIQPEYGAALKLALLVREVHPHAPDVSQMVEFLGWSYDNYLLLAGPLTYGSLALSPSRFRSMMKKVTSGDLDTVFAGVRNAAWDMGLLRYWGRRAIEAARGEEYVLLCSFDKALHRCASNLLCPSVGPHEQLAILRQRLGEEWGQDDAEKVMDAYTRCVIGHDSDSMRTSMHHMHDQKYWDGMIAELEQELTVSVRPRLSTRALDLAQRPHLKVR